MSWHVEVDLLDRYAAGSLPEAAAWSVETHVAGCAACRGVLNDAPPGPVSSMVGDERLAAVWAEVDDRVRLTSRPRTERLLDHLGVPDHDARLLAATPSLTASWLLAVGSVLGAAVLGAWVAGPARPGSTFLFLLVAPLVPLAGVAVAFGPRVDPTHDLAVVAPMGSARLLLLRSVAVVGTSLLLATLGALALPIWGWSSVAWLLPALGLVTAALAAATRCSPSTAGIVLGTGWVVAVVALEAGPGPTLVAFGPTGQTFMAALLAVAAVVLGTGRQRLDPAARP